MIANQTSMLSNLLLFLLGAFITHAWNKYRSRLHRVRWSAQYFRVAVAGEDPLLGRVKVLYNESPVSNVHTASLQIENESNTDLENLVLNLACLEGSTIYMAYGYLEGTLQYLPFTDQYLGELSQPDPSGNVLKRRDFRIPVLNRRAKANIVLLLSREDQAQPLVRVSCVHKGVQLKEKAPGPVFWGVSFRDALIVGWLASFIAVMGLTLFATTSWLVSLGSWLAGLLVIAVGVVLVKVWRALIRFLS